MQQLLLLHLRPIESLLLLLRCFATGGGDLSSFGCLQASLKTTTVSPLKIRVLNIFLALAQFATEKYKGRGGGGKIVTCFQQQFQVCLESIAPGGS
jgi:hypothetical protein